MHADAISDFASTHHLNASAKMRMDASAKKMDATAQILEKRLDLANNEKNQAYDMWKNNLVKPSQNNARRLSTIGFYALPLTAELTMVHSRLC